MSITEEIRRVKVTGASRDDVVRQLYNMISPDDDLELTLSFNVLQTDGQLEEHRIAVASAGSFTQAFHEYERWNSILVSTPYMPDSMDVGETGLRRATERLFVYIGTDTETVAPYCIEGTVMESNAMLSGFRVHRSRLKRWLMENPVAGYLRQNGRLREAYNRMAGGFIDGEFPFRAPKARHHDHFGDVWAGVTKTVREATQIIDHVARNPYYVNVTCGYFS